MLECLQGVTAYVFLLLSNVKFITHVQLFSWHMGK